MDWTKLPEPIRFSLDVVDSVNTARANNAPVDTAQVLAAKVACVALRDYLAQLVTAIGRGEFDVEAFVDHNFAEEN